MRYDHFTHICICSTDRFWPLYRQALPLTLNKVGFKNKHSHLISWLPRDGPMLSPGRLAKARKRFSPGSGTSFIQEGPILTSTRNRFSPCSSGNQFCLAGQATNLRSIHYQLFRSLILVTILFLLSQTDSAGSLVLTSSGALQPFCFIHQVETSRYTGIHYLLVIRPGNLKPVLYTVV
jgi:hypothetical protein